MFWYRRDGDDGPEFVIVDAQTGAKAEARALLPLFLQQRVSPHRGRAIWWSPVSIRNRSSGASISYTVADNTLAQSPLMFARPQPESRQATASVSLRIDLRPCSGGAMTCGSAT
jgi:hypothetical protein